MRSVRFDPGLDQRLEEAAAATGVTVSELIRQAAAEKCDQILSGSVYDRCRAVIGSVRSTAAARRRTASDRTGKVFAELLVKADRRKRRR